MHNPIQYTDNISYPIITFKLFLYTVIFFYILDVKELFML